LSKRHVFAVIYGAQIDTIGGKSGRMRTSILHANQKEYMTRLSDFTVNDLIDTPERLASYAQHVTLVVNTASACKFTPQYAQLQALHEQYAAHGLKIIAFPCNQFGAQESGSAAEIGEFCDRNFHVTFPVMGKIDVNGAQAEPLWQWLKARAPGIFGTQRIKWNFTKFLVAKDGVTVERFAPFTEPLKLRAQIERLLAQ
jgi:glutathione peroxidase